MAPYVHIYHQCAHIVQCEHVRVHVYVHMYTYTTVQYYTTYVHIYHQCAHIVNMYVYTYTTVQYYTSTYMYVYRGMCTVY